MATGEKEAHMAGGVHVSSPDSHPRQARISRHRTASTKLTETEYAQVEQLAEAHGQWLSEWVRDVILAAVQEHRNPQRVATFTEMQALRLLLINTLEPLLRGEKMTPEQFKEMLRYVKSNKRKAAADMLASYAEGATDQP
jgi:hypothetical protein